MILGLRRRHLGVFAVLAPLLPAGLVAALLSRDPLPVAPDLPAELAGGVPDRYLDRLEWSRGGALWDDAGIEIARVPNPGGFPEVAFHPTRDLKAPKVLVYWSPGLKRTDSLPGDAVLLGALAGTQTVVFPLPLAMRNRPGRFLIYSLGHQRILVEGVTKLSS